MSVASDQDVAAAEATPEAPAATTPPAPSSPWAQDVAARFTDADVAAGVDSFLRETVQPYVTQLEQATVENRDAQRLWDDFRTNPLETYISIAEELYGEDAARSIAEQLTGSTTEPETTEPEGDTTPPTPQLDPAAQEAIEYVNEKRREEAYAAELARTKEAHSDVEIKDELFHPFVAAADGDFDLAVAGYKDWLDTAKAEFAPSDPAPEATETAEAETPPPTLGSDQRAPSAPPVTPDYDKDDFGKAINEAMDDFFSDTKPAPPTV